MLNDSRPDLSRVHRRPTPALLPPSAGIFEPPTGVGVPAVFRATVDEFAEFLEAAQLAVRASAWDAPDLEALAATADAGLGAGFARYTAVLDAALRDVSAIERTSAVEYGRTQLQPYLLASPTLARAWSKPLGYPGDHLVMHGVYATESAAGSAWGKVVDRLLGRLQVVRACRARCRQLAGLIRLGLKEANDEGRSAHLAAYACGPAQELATTTAGGPLPEGTDGTVLLLDPKAESVAFCARRYADQAPGASTNLRVHAHQLGLREVLHRSPVTQRLRQRFDLLWCVGLFNYVDDATAVRAIAGLLRLVRPGGSLVVGSLDHHRAEGLMEIVTGWPLVYRSRGALLALVDAAARSRGESVETQLQTEPNGINHFVVARRAVWGG